MSQVVLTEIRIVEELLFHSTGITSNNAQAILAKAA